MNSPIKDAEIFIGRSLTKDEVGLFTNPHGISCLVDESYSPKKRNILLLMACQSDMLKPYLKGVHSVNDTFNINLISVARILRGGFQDNPTELISMLYKTADVIIGHNFSEQYDKQNTKHHPGKTDRRILTFSPPNNSAFWPISKYWNSPELANAASLGKTKQQVWKEFQNGTFDPMFSSRYESEKKWMIDRESDCDIKMSDFIHEHHKTHKMFFTENHPTYNLMAWIGRECVRLLGFDCDSIGTVLSYPHDMMGTWNAKPETDYEFRHYGFSYNKRYANEQGGMSHYKDLIFESSAFK